jgi:hypothetical protein
VSAAGGSVGRWGQELREDARRGPWRRLLTLLGVKAHTRRADAQAAACEAGAVGEARTAALLAPLQAAGWRVLHDRRIPGARRANADHIVITPAARVYVVDSKLWSAKWPVHAEGGRLTHGDAARGGDRSRSVRSLLFETKLVERALGHPVQPLMVMHNAPIVGGRLVVEGIPVMPAGMLVQALVFNDGVRDPGALLLAERADRVLPPYRG